MKVSKYTFFIEKHGKSCLYNTFSNSLISIDKVLFERLKEFSNNQQFEESELDESEENIELLKRGKFVTDNDMDDFLQLKSIFSFYRNNDKIMGLTIAPTMDCNFNCFYCFEEHHQEYMTSEEIQAIINYIESKKDIQALYITWFGGEPLMAVDKIKEFYQKFRSFIKNVTSSIITNGYYMSLDVVDMFKENNFNRIQISIDGMGNDYNMVKYSKSDQNCWDTIVKNLDYLLTTTNINTNIRVNLQDNNPEKYLNILSFFKNRYPGHKHLYVAPAFLTTNRIIEKQSTNDYILKQSDRVKFDSNVSKTLLENNLEGGGFLYPSNALSECSTRNANTMGIGPGGLLYNCWENIGNKEQCFGVLDKDGNVKVTDHKLLNRYLHGEDPLADRVCQKCQFLPICMGGCPHWRIRNFYEGAKIDICTYFKSGLSDYLEKRIELFMKRKKQSV